MDVDLAGGTLIGRVFLGNHADGRLDMSVGALSGDVVMGNSEQVFA